jgi:hypothetical protein
MLYALLQFVEGDDAAIQKRARINRGLNAARVTIEEADAKCGFHIGDCLGYCGLRHQELGGSLPHAAAPGHRHQNMEVAQL